MQLPGKGAAELNRLENLIKNKEIAMARGQSLQDPFLNTLRKERVPVSIGHRATLFQQELVQTLAEGDPNLLGASA